MSRFSFSLILVFWATTAQAQVDEYNLPVALRGCLQNEQRSDLVLSDRMNPFFLRGDFNGDGNLDFAVLVSQRTTGKQGIAVCLAGERAPIVIGAGRAFAFEGGKQFDDLKSFDSWKIDDDSLDRKPARAERIHLIAKERGSGLIYWNGKEFRWKQLGI